ncbi:MAG TPA: hypothetical protein VIS74_08505, partial [Chthoniobacterales bacterium]
MSTFPAVRRFLGLLWLAVPFAAAQPLPETQVPAPLRDWVTWATWDAPHRNCPAPYFNSKKHLCFWPGRLDLTAAKTGGAFTLEVTVFSESWVPLPGGKNAWPLEVKLAGQPLPVLERDGRPSVRLAPGKYRLEGIYRWNDLPQSLPLPREIGLLTLTLEGQAVEAPAWDAQGLLWLKRDGSSEETDKDFLATKVYGLLEDGIPLWLQTEIELVVSGKSREEELGAILPAGWKLSAVESPIPVAVDETGRVKAQVRAGKWTIKLRAFRLDDPRQFQFAADAPPGMAEELIAFRSKPDFRMVEIVGAPSIDVSQTTFPAQWREFPVYRWDTAAPFQMEERMRGMGLQQPEGLTIHRELWLDSAGRELTFRDRLTGSMQQIWRLDAAAGQDLGSVRSNGVGQLITRNPATQAPGVEIRTRNLNLEATGRSQIAGGLSATGWQTDADAVQVTLNLPPGWRLFALFGPDWVRGDWLTAWSLLDLFLLLLFTLAVFRLWGLWPAVLAFLAFGLSYHEPGAPRYAWLALLVPLALLRVVPAGWGHRLITVGKWLVIVVLVFALVPFLARQVRQAIYPQLEDAITNRQEFTVSRKPGDSNMPVPSQMPLEEAQKEAVSDYSFGLSSQKQSRRQSEATKSNLF